MPKDNECPWAKETIKDVAKKAVSKCGGQRGFDFIGPDMREAIVAEAVLGLFMSACIVPITITKGQIAATYSAMRKACGIPEDE